MYKKELGFILIFILALVIMLLSGCGVNINISKPTLDVNFESVDISANFPIINKTIYNGIELKGDLLKVYFINVSQGDSQLIIFPDNKTMLIDAGKESYGYKVKELLDELNITKLNYCLVSHNHEDHYGGFKIVGFMCEINQTYNMQYGFNIYPKDNYSNENDNSIITKITYKNISFLFTGDCAEECENEIIQHNLSADILKVSHHGSKTSTSDEFLVKVNPTIAVISVGKNSYGHPSEIILQKLKYTNLLRTDYNGTILIQTDGNKIRITK